MITTDILMFTSIERPDDAAAGALFAWFSPAFPTGGFAYSHGLESAAAESRIHGEQGLLAWLQDVLEFGAGWSDAVVMAMAHRAALAGDEAALASVAGLAAALAPSRERQAEAIGQGQAFLSAVRAGWPQATPDTLPDRIAYPVAAGAASAGIGAPLRTALNAYLTGFASNLIAAGVRLGFCGQTGGVRTLSALGPLIAEAARRAEQAGEDDLGGCALAGDIASMRHETLNGRLFLS
jgi:urease accessory protein